MTMLTLGQVTALHRIPHRTGAPVLRGRIEAGTFEHVFFTVPAKGETDRLLRMARAALDTGRRLKRAARIEGQIRAEDISAIHAQLSCRELAQATIGGALGRVLAVLGASIDAVACESHDDPQPLLNHLWKIQKALATVQMVSFFLETSQVFPRLTIAIAASCAILLLAVGRYLYASHLAWVIGRPISREGAGVVCGVAAAVVGQSLDRVAAARLWLKSLVNVA